MPKFDFQRFCFIEFETVEHQEAALENKYGLVLQRRELRIQAAEPPSQLKKSIPKKNAPEEKKGGLQTASCNGSNALHRFITGLLCWISQF